jgi:hypothetical protein
MIDSIVYTHFLYDFTCGVLNIDTTQHGRLHDLWLQGIDSTAEQNGVFFSFGDLIGVCIDYGFTLGLAF